MKIEINKEEKELLLGILDVVNVPGKIVEQFIVLKKKIQEAKHA